MLKPLQKFLFRKAEGRYGLPLNNNGGSGFIVLLITLMTFLAVLALSATFALGGMTARWSSGLENKLTIELPTADSGGKIYSKDEINSLKIKVKKTLDSIDNISKIDIIGDDELQALLAPWLGNDFALDDVPMPALIAVETKGSSKGQSSDAFSETLQAQLSEIDSAIRVDAHKEWLEDFLRLIGSVKFVTFFVSVLIGLTAAVAIAGVIRSRMSEHRPDVELLHLMGASDQYIARQFERYALRLGLLGGAFGLLAGSFGLLLFSAVIGGRDGGVLPSVEFGVFAIVVLLSLPMLACALCAGTARITVLRALARMP